MGLLQLKNASYEIAWDPPTNGGSRSGITGTSITIDGLISNTPYTFTARISASEEQPSDSVTIATGLFKRIKNLFAFLLNILLE